MSGAAEKLRALEQRGRVALKKPISQSSRWNEEMVLADLLDALPQLMAVVEAAESEIKQFSAGRENWSLEAALAALNEALNGTP